MVKGGGDEDTGGDSTTGINTVKPSLPMTTSGGESTAGMSTVKPSFSVTASSSGSTAGMSMVKSSFPKTASGGESTAGTGKIKHLLCVPASRSGSTAGMNTVKSSFPVTAFGGGSTAGMSTVNPSLPMTSSDGGSTAGMSTVKSSLPVTAPGHSLTAGWSSVKPSLPMTASGGGPTAGVTLVKPVGLVKPVSLVRPSLPMTASSEQVMSSVKLSLPMTASGGDLVGGVGMVKPRPPMNAFMLFCKGQRSIILKKNPRLPMSAVSRLLGETWKNLSQSEKATYTKEAAELRRSFEMAHPYRTALKRHNRHRKGSSLHVKTFPSHKVSPPKQYLGNMHTAFKTDAYRVTSATTNELAFNFTMDDLVDQGKIGQGSYGTVFKMYHKQSKTVMAVKRIPSEVDAKEKKQLLVDLDVVMKSNRCPFIVQLLGAFFEKDDCWICMELMALSVDKLYKHVYGTMQYRIPEDILGKIAVAILSALTYMSDELRIVHRDVKPSNIFVDASGNIKLRDTGITERLIRSIASRNDCKPYLAPERIDPRASSIGYDIRSDVWSLGITLVEIATGKFPYPKCSSAFEMLNQIVQGEPQRLLDTDDQYSPTFKDFVNSCLIKDQEKRPKYKTLSKHDLIKTYKEKEVDVAEYVSKVLIEIQDFEMGAPGSSKNEPELQDMDSFEEQEEGMSELSSSDEETESPLLDQNTAENRENERRDRFAKAEELDDKLDVPLSRWNLVSRIDTEDQILRIFCPEERKDEVEQALQVELKNVKEELHSFVQVVGMDTSTFSIERHNGIIRGGSEIYYVNAAGGKECVTLGHVLANVKDNKLYALTTCHRDDVIGKNFFFTHNGKEVVLGVCVAVTCSSQPLSESCLVELSEEGCRMCCACLGTSFLKPPTVFSGPYSGTTDKLVSPPKEVIMCTKTLKRGTIKSIRCRFPDPDDASRRISGGILTVAVGTWDLSVKGHSGAVIAQASSQPFPVKGWCKCDSSKQAENSHNQLSDGEYPIIVEGPSRNAIPTDDPSRVILPMVVESQETPQTDPALQVEVQSPPMSMNCGSDTITDIPPLSPHSIVNPGNMSQPNPTTQVNIDPNSTSLDPNLNVNTSPSPFASLNSGQTPLINMAVPFHPAFLNPGHAPMTDLTVASPTGALNAQHAHTTNVTVASLAGSLNAQHAPMTVMTIASPPFSLNSEHAPTTNVTVSSPPASLNAQHAPTTNTAVAPHLASLSHGHAPLTNMTVASAPGSFNTRNYPLTGMAIDPPLTNPNSRSDLERTPLTQDGDESLSLSLSLESFSPRPYQKRTLLNGSQRNKKVKRNVFTQVFGSSWPVVSGEADYFFDGPRRSICSFISEETDMEDVQTVPKTVVSYDIDVNRGKHEQTYIKSVVKSSYDTDVTQREHATPFSTIGDNGVDLATGCTARGTGSSTRVSIHVPLRGNARLGAVGGVLSILGEGDMANRSVKMPKDMTVKRRAKWTAGSSEVSNDTTSEYRQRCTCYLEKQAMAHEAISMHCFGMKVLDGGELKGASVSFRLNLALTQLEEQIPDAKLELVPILECAPMQG